MLRKMTAGLISALFIAGIQNQIINAMEPTIDYKKKHVDYKYSNNSNKELIVDADLLIHSWDEIAEISIDTNEENQEKIIFDLLTSKYENVDELETADYKEWKYNKDGVLLAKLSINKYGYLEYLDALNDRNGDYIDLDHILEYGYITNKLPSGILITVEEAIEEVKQKLQEYSDLSFEPWNALAIDGVKNTNQAGYYEILFQAYYNNIPISVKSDANSRGFYISADYGEDGIFSLDGPLLFSKIAERELEQHIGLETILEKYIEKFDFFGDGEKIELNQIVLEYLPEYIGMGKYVLTPVWTLECVDIRNELEPYETEPVVSRYNIMYYVENGEFCGLYY